MFESLETLPADAILGLIAEHRNDPRDNTIDLGVGVYRTAAGETPVLDVIKVAEQRLLDQQDTKAYIGTFGDPAFNAAMRRVAPVRSELRPAQSCGRIPTQRCGSVIRPGQTMCRSWVAQVSSFRRIRTTIPTST